MAKKIKAHTLFVGNLLSLAPARHAKLTQKIMKGSGFFYIAVIIVK